MDKIIYKKYKTHHELTIIYISGRQFSLTADTLDGLMSLLEDWMIPVGMSERFESYEQYTSALNNSLEDTKVA